MRQFKWGITVILRYLLSNGVGVGEHDKRSLLNRTCRTLVHSFNTRSFTLGFNEYKDIGKESFFAFVKYIS